MISFGTLLTPFKACLNLGAFQELSLCNWGLESLGFGPRVHGTRRVHAGSWFLVASVELAPELLTVAFWGQELSVLGLSHSWG